jgi:metal-responsive CopG/Arc/MetJ family transcriptional regulator
MRIGNALEILSISIDKEALRQLEEVQRKLGFKSRSKLLRSAIQSLLKDYEGLELLTGSVESVFVLTYGESEKNHVSNLLHRFEDTIETETHHHHSDTCIDVLNISATARVTRELFGTLKKSKCIYSITYSVVPKSK